MTRVGVPWDRSTVANLENGRRATVSVEELFVLAYVLSVAPVHLVVPLVDADDKTQYRVTPAVATTRAALVRAWIRGEAPFGEDIDVKRYFAEVPDSEWVRPTAASSPHEGLAKRQNAPRKAD